MRTDYYYQNCHRMVLAHGGPVAHIIMMAANIYLDAGINSLPKEIGKAVTQIMDNVDETVGHAKVVIEVRGNRLANLNLPKELRVFWRDMVGSRVFLSSIKKNFFPADVGRATLICKDWGDIPLKLHHSTGKFDNRYPATVKALQAVEVKWLGNKHLKENDTIEEFRDRLIARYKQEQRKGKVSANLEAILFLVSLKAATNVNFKCPKYLQTDLEAFIKGGGNRYIPITMHSIINNKHLHPSIQRFLPNIEQANIHKWLRTHYLKPVAGKRPHINYRNNTNCNRVPFMLSDDGILETNLLLTQSFVSSNLTY